MRIHPTLWLGGCFLVVFSIYSAPDLAAKTAKATTAAKTEKGPAKTAKNPQGSRSAALVLPWKIDHVYRYLWLRDGERVGETQFRLSKVPSADQPGGFLYELTSGRNYDHEQSSQRARLLSYFSLDGTPQRFTETLHVMHLKKFVAIQETSMELIRNKARVTFMQKGQDGKPKKKPKVKETRLPTGTFLFSSQAVEHWAIFVGTFPKEFQTQKIKLFYPQFSKVFDLTFRREGVETIQLGKTAVRSYRASFRSQEISGSIWTDSEGRLLQVEFPQTKVRVVLEAVK